MRRAAAILLPLGAAGLAALALAGGPARPRTSTHATPDALAGTAGANVARRTLAGVSEGVRSTNAVAWQAAGYNGQGVTVAVMDSGFKDRSAVGNATLAGTYCSAPDSSQHGSAVAEIVHEMAPAAAILLYCVDNETELASAAAAAESQGARVIVESLSWFNDSRGDGSAGSGPDAIVRDARSRGVLWVNSAGNFARRHWSGTFADADGDGWTEFAAGDEGNSFTVPGHGSTCAYLKWDSWSSPTNPDFDLHLWRQMGSSTTDQVATGTPDASAVPLASSTDSLANKAPTEQLCWTNPSDDAAPVFLAIYRRSGSGSPRFDLFVTNPDLQYQTAAGSVAEPATSPSVLGVGAACWQGNGLESYSSRGPTIDGRIKPDLVGPDSVSSPFGDFGSFTGECGASGFRGSSAAAPHVAGAAALVLSRNPGWTPDQVESYLEQNATNLGPAGKDNDTGAGMLHLPNFPPPPPPPPPPAAKVSIAYFQTLPARSRAGQTFRAQAVVKADGQFITEGRVACPATLAGRALKATTARFRGGVASCAWSLPQRAGGKLLRGSLRVTYERGTARRTFAQRVRPRRR
jgi:subtilisin family serine protease